MSKPVPATWLEEYRANQESAFRETLAFDMASRLRRLRELDEAADILDDFGDKVLADEIRAKASELRASPGDPDVD